MAADNALMSDEEEAVLLKIRDLVELQADLLACYRETIPIGLSEAGPVPARRGELRLRGQLWEYGWHGGGILFREVRTRRAVDMHNRLDDPSLFDVWRLRTYFGSLRNRGVRLVQQVVGVRQGSLDSLLKTMVAKLEARGFIVAEERWFRLAASEVDPSRGPVPVERRTAGAGPGGPKPG